MKFLRLPSISQMILHFRSSCSLSIVVFSVELWNISYRIRNSSAWWLNATCSHCNRCWSVWLAWFWQYPVDGGQHNYWCLGSITGWWNKQCISSSHCSYWEQPCTQLSVIQHVLHRHGPLGNILRVWSIEVWGETMHPQAWVAFIGVAPTNIWFSVRMKVAVGN